MRESCRMGAMLAMADDIASNRDNNSYSNSDGFGTILVVCALLLGALVFIVFCFTQATEGNIIALLGAIAITITPLIILLTKLAKKMEKREQEKRQKNRQGKTEKWKKNFDWDY